MTVLRWEELASGDRRGDPGALTIGVFDGVHRGHMALISAVTCRPGCTPVVVTFSAHPAVVLGGNFPGFLMSEAQKRAALEEAGAGILVLIDFDLSFSRIPAARFLDALCAAFNVRHAAIGWDFRCGSDAFDATRVKEYLEAAGTSVDIVQPRSHAGRIVSSTRIRRCIEAGRMSEAADLLGRPYSLDVSASELRNTERVEFLRTRSGKLTGSGQILPPNGRYPATVISGAATTLSTVTIGDKSITLPLAVNDGIRYIVVQENGLKDQGD